MPPRLALKLVLNHATKDSFVSDAHGQPPDRGCFCGEPLVNHTAVRGVIKQAWVGCDGCGRWCHAKCTNGGWRHKTYICPRCADSLDHPSRSTDDDALTGSTDDDATSPPRQ